MPKTKSEAVLRHYPPLREVKEEEWDLLFDRQGKAWDADELDYLREWYGKESTINISYALGRLPYSVQERARKLGISASTNCRANLGNHHENGTSD